jgi:hypothetical protein
MMGWHVTWIFCQRETVCLTLYYFSADTTMLLLLFLLLLTALHVGQGRTSAAVLGWRPQHHTRSVSQLQPASHIFTR